MVIRTFCCLILIWHPLTFYVAFCDLSLPLLTHASTTVLGTSGNTNATLSPHCLNPMAAYHPWDQSRVPPGGIQCSGHPRPCTPPSWVSHCSLCDRITTLLLFSASSPLPTMVCPPTNHTATSICSFLKLPSTCHPEKPVLPLV